MRDKSCLFGAFAASIGFYLILSMAPFMAVVIGSTFHFFHIDLTLPAITILKDMLPPESRDNATGMVSAVSRIVEGSTLTVTLIFALVTTHSFMHALVRALRYIFSTEQFLPKTTLTSTLISMALVVLWALVFAFFAIFILISPSIEVLLQDLDLFSESALWLWSLSKYFATFFFVWLAIHLTYQLTDANRHPLNLRLQSSLLASVAWLGLGYAFSHIIPALWSASMLHGTLGGLIALLIWAHATAWVLLLGACLVVRRFNG
ncbi:MAG: YihY/virulence factor BrkB family protein [Blastochloris sp.]|nr:YihY/virulence factor BrkB family protein [Blastochloris sp.]